ncbi:MAG: CHAT domain-containing protein, partial [Chloroflexota bacterium]
VYSTRLYELALEVYTRAAFPEQWATTQNNLANAYKNRIRGERADNLEEAIRHFELALEVYTRAAFPTDWAMTQNNLANAYSNRIRGERADNLEEAIRHYELALEVRTRAAFPEQWATTQNNLATAYADRIRGERADNLEEAIRHYELALEVYTRAAFPEQWSGTQNNLGEAYRNRIRGERADNLEEAIRHYELALEVRTRAAFPEQWATTQNNLATAYSDRILGKRADNLEEAIRHCELALEVRTRAAFPTDWGMTQNNLANAYLYRIRGERADNLEAAIRHFEQALLEYTPKNFPERARTTSLNLAAVGETREDWRAVHRALTTAAAAGERLFLATVSQFGEQTEAQELAHLYDRDLLVCLRLIAADAEVARDALSDAEAARSRAFLRQLSLGDFAPPASIPAPLVGQEKNILAQLRATQNDLARLVAPRDLKPKTEGTLTDRMSEMERALTERRKQLLDEVERVRNDMLSASPDAADYVSLRRAETPKWNDLSALAARVGKDAALVEFHLLNDQTLAFVWRAGWDNPKMLSLPLTRERLLHRYLLPYEREVLNIYRRSQAQASGRELYHDWLGLGEELLAPLEPLLGDASLVYFIPHQFLHLLPLHALTVNGEPFIARRAVAYAPSAAVLGRVLDPKGFGNPSGLGGALVMSYSEIDWQNDWFMDEARQVAALFGAIPLANASRDTLESRAPDASLIHLLAHGLYDREDSLNSGVALKGGIFTARDWMRLDLRADLVTLASCELGFSDVNPGDDVVGMTRALLYAGASSVLLALWSVYAKTTVKWMLDFYQRIKPDATPQAKAYAFQDATLALRAQDNDPYVWAPFVLVGNWM